MSCTLSEEEVKETMINFQREWDIITVKIDRLTELAQMEKLLKSDYALTQEIYSMQDKLIEGKVKLEEEKWEFMESVVPYTERRKRQGAKS